MQILPHAKYTMLKTCVDNSVRFKIFSSHQSVIFANACLMNGRNNKSYMYFK